MNVRDGRWRDSSSRYGRLSILLHWSAGSVVLAMWFIGTGIRGDATGMLGRLQVHTTLGLSAYFLLWWRIAWRLRRGHPTRPGSGPGSWNRRLTGFVHYAMLYALAWMLLTGPVLAWAGGLPLSLFGWTAPSPLSPNAALHSVLLTSHQAGASVIMVGILIHVAGVLKHIAWDGDDTLDRMIVPAPAEADTGPDPRS